MCLKRHRELHCLSFGLKMSIVQFFNHSPKTLKHRIHIASRPIGIGEQLLPLTH